MHTSRVNGTSFVHNGDYSGEIRIVGKDSDGKESEVEVQDLGTLLKFVMSALKSEVISALESDVPAEKLLEVAKVLGISFNPKDGRPREEKKSR